LFGNSFWWAANPSWSHTFNGASQKQTGIRGYPIKIVHAVPVSAFTKGGARRRVVVVRKRSEFITKAQQKNGHFQSKMFSTFEK